MAKGKLTTRRYEEIDEALNHASDLFLQLSNELGDVLPNQDRPQKLYIARLVATIRSDIEKLHFALTEQEAWERIVNTVCTPE